MLTLPELRTLRLLSTGATTAFIAVALNVTPGRVHMLYVYIRDKTGIKDLFDKRQVLAYMETQRPKRQKRPTPAQLACMRLFVDDWDYRDISRKLGLGSAQVAQNHIYMGCKRLGIERHFHEEYLSTFRVQWRFRRLELIENYLHDVDSTPWKTPPPRALPKESCYPDTFVPISPTPPLNGDPCF